jgi:hypothetical protein
MLRALARLDSIDPRWLYLALIAAVALPLAIDVPLPSRMGYEARGYYDAIERVPKNGIVLIHSDWDAGVLGELKGQFTATIDHLFSRSIKFAIVTSNPQGTAFSDSVTNRMAKIYHKQYGKDWVQLGYIIPGSNVPQAVQALAKDFQGQAQYEIRYHTPIRDIPWLRNVSNAGDFALIINIIYQPTKEWLQFATAVYGTPYIAGVASIASSDMYPLLTSGQLKGMLVGARGGAEYEARRGLPAFDKEQHTRQKTWDDLAFATKVIKSQSFAHIWLILGAVIGNVGFYARRRLQTREQS